MSLGAVVAELSIRAGGGLRKVPEGARGAAGLRHPGGESLELIEALRRVDIPYVLTHHETAAGFMAAATAQLSGVPGVCIVTRGPGAL